MSFVDSDDSTKVKSCRQQNPWCFLVLIDTGESKEAPHLNCTLDVRLKREGCGVGRRLWEPACQSCYDFCELANGTRSSALRSIVRETRTKSLDAKIARSTFSNACSRTFAPLAMSCGLENSLG